MCAVPLDWDSVGSRTQEFRTTHWSVVLATGQCLSSSARTALEALCRDYWYPVYAHIRRSGYGPEDAEDLTQGFFARLLERDFFARARRERGRFRTFLLTALRHFLGDERDRACATKRGGGQSLVSLDGERAEVTFQRYPASEATAEILFERRWALALLETVRVHLRAEYAAEGKAERFACRVTFKTGILRAIKTGMLCAIKTGGLV